MDNLTTEKKQAIVEAALMVSDQPLSINALQQLFAPDCVISAPEMREILAAITERYATSGLLLQEVASGYRFQARAELSPWLAKLWTERSPRYSRALLETIAIIAYKQPITRAEIEEIRGVTVSSTIMKTLQEREWIKLLGYREMPGKPGIYGTTKEFLNYFNLKSLNNLPPLAEFKSLHAQDLQVQLAMQDNAPSDSEVIPAEREALELDDEEVTTNIIQLDAEDEETSSEATEEDDFVSAR